MFFSVNIVPAAILALSLVDGAVSVLITVSPELATICPRTTRTTTSLTTIIAPACPTVTTRPGFIGCPILEADVVCPEIACPLLDKAIVPIGCPTRCCPIKTPTVTLRPTCPPRCPGCPGPIIEYAVADKLCPIAY